MSSTVPLNAAVSVVLDASGNGTASIGPTGFGEVWQAGFCAAVSTVEITVTNEAICRVYCAGRLIGGTTWGSTGDSSTDTPQLATGQVVQAKWTGGDPGATAVLDITGSRTVA